MNYNFKSIKSVVSAKDLVNIVLSKTQRKTPTVIHANFSMTRIRAFYMRKVKFTQETIHEKLSNIVDGFPKLNDIHPFFADLINVLYDKDHYKLALGHVHSCRNLVDNISKDYVRLLKYGDSLYRCKMLKKAALGRMCTIIKKLSSSLSYLDEVRKHLARLPSINPFERTLLITGYPNVGKSSFTNKITNANVEVQPYPFTTQALYVGHTDYNYVRWQVIDSPGILDHPLEQRNTIEMQSITALAHLKACILFFIDLSETCGYTLDQQIKLYQSLTPLFQNKPHIIVLTKTDLRPLSDLSPEEQQQLNDLKKEENVQMVAMSNKSGEGLGEVKKIACEQLQEYRLEQNPEKVSGGDKLLKKEEEFLKGIYVARPKTRALNVARPPHIPQEIQEEGRKKLERETLKDIQEKMGGAGVFNFPLQEHFILENPDWKYDHIPEILDGKNIGDFVDKDILKKLEELEREEAMMEQALENEIEEEEEELDEEMMGAMKEISKKRSSLKLQHRLKRHTRTHLHRPTEEEVKEDFQKMDIDPKPLQERMLNKKKQKILRKQQFMSQLNQSDDDDKIEVETQASVNTIKQKSMEKRRSMSRSRSKGQIRPEKTEKEKKNEKVVKRGQLSWIGRAGEGDRRICSSKPKHLFSGKRKQGTHDRR